MKTLGDWMQHYADTHNLNELEGHCRSTISGVGFFRAGSGTPRQALLYDSGLIVMGKGRKTMYMGNKVHRYGPGDCLVLGVPVPVECEAVAINNEPLLGLTVDVESQTLQRLVNIMRQYQPQLTAPCETDCGVSSVQLDDEGIDACVRLLKALCDPVEAEALAANIVNEIIFRVLTGPQGHILLGLANHDGHYARVARSLKTIHTKYPQALTVEELAKEAHLSVSAFHRAFKQVTLESPLQYLKKVRLSKAKDLILLDGRKANEAARLVGYSSPTQFSREFKRQYLQSPGKLAR